MLDLPNYLKVFHSLVSSKSHNLNDFRSACVAEWSKVLSSTSDRTGLGRGSGLGRATTIKPSNRRFIEVQDESNEEQLTRIKDRVLKLKDDSV